MVIRLAAASINETDTLYDDLVVYYPLNDLSAPYRDRATLDPDDGKDGDGAGTPKPKLDSPPAGGLNPKPLKFTSANNQVVHYNATLGLGSTDFTVSFYFHATAGSAQYLVTQDTSADRGWWAEWDGSGENVVFGISSDGSDTYEVTIPAAAGELHHAVLSYDKDLELIAGLVDGVSGQAAGPAVWNHATVAPFNVGARGAPGAAGGYFDGMIEHVGIWNRTLTEAELAKLLLGYALY